MLSRILCWFTPRGTGGVAAKSSIDVVDDPKGELISNESEILRTSVMGDCGSASSGQSSEELNYPRNSDADATIPILEPVAIEFQGPDGASDALGFIDHFASISGFSASVKRSNMSESRQIIRRMTVVCMHSGMYKPHVKENSQATKTRANQFTLKRNCPFSVEIYDKALGPKRAHNISGINRRKLSGTFCIDVINGSHNHGVVDLSAIPRYRQRDLILKHESLIMTELNNGTTIMEIIKRMRDADVMRGDRVLSN